MLSPERGGTPQPEQVREPQAFTEAQEPQLGSPEQQALSKSVVGGFPTREEQLQQAVDDGYLDDEAASNLLFSNPDGSIPLDFFIFRDAKNPKDQSPG